MTIHRSPLQRIDRLADGKFGREIVERALKRSLQDRQRSELEEQIAAYDGKRQKDEWAEDREWSELRATHGREDLDLNARPLTPADTIRSESRRPRSFRETARPRLS